MKKSELRQIIREEIKALTEVKKFKPNDIIHGEDQLDFKDQVAKELGLEDLPIYFDDADMVDDKTNKTIMRSALGSYTYKELVKVIKKKIK
jgi:hypothetical protein